LEEQQFDMAQQTSSDGSALGVVAHLIFLAISAVLFFVTVAGAWKTFEKAGRPGWHAIIPIYQWVQGARIAGMSGWWAVLMFIPGANLVAGIIWGQNMARLFGHGALFGLGLTFFYPLFFAILGFGSAEYAPDAPSSRSGQPMRRAA
jgi:hypothetical protein